MTNFTRIGTLALHQNTLVNAGKTQQDLYLAQRQISSGLRANTYVDLAGQVEQVGALEDQMAKTEMFLRNNRIIQARLDTTDNVLEKIIDITNDIKNTTIQRRNAASAIAIDYLQALQAAFESIAGQLNQTLNGKYIFAGARSDTPPVIDSFPDSVTLGTPDAGYYQGSQEDIIARIDNNREVTLDVRADDAAIQNIFAALALAKEADVQDDDDLLSQAFALFQEGVDGVVSLRARLNTTGKTIVEVNDRHQTQQTYSKNLRTELLDADLVSLSTQVAVDQAILQASFQAFSRINSLRLTDFLR